MVNTLAFFQNIGMPELIVIMVIALLIFGSRLPQVARSLGKGITEFKKGMSEASNQVTREIEAAGEMPAPPKPDTQAPAGSGPPALPAAERAGTAELPAPAASAPTPTDVSKN